MIDHDDYLLLFADLLDERLKLRRLASLRTRRERQWQRLFPVGEIVFRLGQYRLKSPSRMAHAKGRLRREQRRDGVR